MKQFLMLGLLLAGLSLNAQIAVPPNVANPVKLSPAVAQPAIAVVAPTNAPVTGDLVLNADGTVTVNPQDLLNFISPKYRSLVLFLSAVFAVPLLKAATAKMAGGTVSQSLASAFVDKHVQVANEISQLKVRTGLPLTPAKSPIAPTPPPVAPIVPLTSLPPKP